MLYATTRSKVGIYTAQRALKEERSPDGGLYLPIQIPVYSEEEIRGLKEKSAAGIIAEILNRFFNCKLTQWDVEFDAGKRFYELPRIGYRMAAAELWNNPNGSLEKLEQVLTQKVSAEPGISRPGSWMRVAVRIALLFAIFGELEAEDLVSPQKCMDVSVATGDFTGPFAVWYAGKMGLPIGTVVCCCNENGGIWDLICRGQMRLGVKAVKTNTPAYDTAVPAGLEWYIHLALDREESAEFLRLQAEGGTYELNKEQHLRIRRGMYAAVSSSERLGELVPNLYNTNGYVLDAYGALVYVGLCDYRSVTGRRNPGVLLLERKPGKKRKR